MSVRYGKKATIVMAPYSYGEVSVRYGKRATIAQTSLPRMHYYDRGSNRTFDYDKVIAVI